MHTCRDAVLNAFQRLERRTGHKDFNLAEIVNEVVTLDGYKETTVRTHVSSRMCADAPDNHAVVYADLQRVARGRYRRR